VSELRFDNQAIVITGAGRGMGRTHALELAARGANVVVNDLGSDSDGNGSSPSPAQSVVDEIVASGGSAVANTDSVATSEGCDALIAAAIEQFGRIDAIIHNAGIVTFVPVAQLDDATLDPMVAVHLLGAIRLTRAAWPHLVSFGGGRILYISSAAGLFGVRRLAHYGSAKAAVAALAKLVALEGQDLRIRANALAVFATTRLTEASMADEPERLEWSRRYMRPELTTAAAAWLVHPDCPATGETYHALGGRVSRVFMAETRGYAHLDLTPELVRDHFAEIRSTDGWYEPDDDAHVHRFTAELLTTVGAAPKPDERKR
jgi:NAD(P)-dependent dehydrogenase (short-subunit alcohol dehydrogenase family)